MQSWTEQNWVSPVAPMALIANSFICVVCQKKTKNNNKMIHALLNWASGFVTFVLLKIMFECKKSLQMWPGKHLNNIRGLDREIALQGDWRD